MKSKYSLSIYSALLLLVLAACSTKTQDEKYRQVVMRDVGHKVLWSLGDSVSRVMPIVSHGSTYTISFESPVAVSYDSVVAVVYRELHKNDMARFVTELKDCGTNEVLLAFAFNSPKDSLAPCVGRDMETACYKIEITLTESRFSYASSLPWGIAMALGGWLFFIFKKRNRRPTSAKATAPNRPTLQIGRYTFDAEARTLAAGDGVSLLTEKEAKLLSLLLANINQTLSRETLMAEIWGEEGLVVIPKNIDVLVSKLRKKLNHDDSVAIANVHGVGYKLVDIAEKG